MNVAMVTGILHAAECGKVVVGTIYFRCYGFNFHLFSKVGEGDMDFPFQNGL